MPAVGRLWPSDDDGDDDDDDDDGDGDDDHLEESLLLLLVLVDQLSDQGGSVLVRARVPVYQMIKVGDYEETIAIMTQMARMVVMRKTLMTRYLESQSSSRLYSRSRLSSTEHT